VSGLPVHQVAENLYVAPQLDGAAMALAAQMGFRSVINNRPDFEHGPGQPTDAEIRAAAEAAGLQYRFLPVSGGYQSPQEIEAFAQLLRELPAPVLAFCRSGARSARLATAALGG
jgi:uncharacterized protein (TIGR01244 family)